TMLPLLGGSRPSGMSLGAAYHPAVSLSGRNRFGGSHAVAEPSAPPTSAGSDQTSGATRSARCHLAVCWLSFRVTRTVHRLIPVHAACNCDTFVSGSAGFTLHVTLSVPTIPKHSRRRAAKVRAPRGAAEVDP